MSALPPMLALYWMGIGHYHSRALGLVAKLGLADLLKDGPRDARALAKPLELNAPALNRVLRLLASVGVLDAAGDGVVLPRPAFRQRRRRHHA